MPYQVLLIAKLSHRHHHNNENWNLNYVVEVKPNKASFGLPSIVYTGPSRMPDLLVERQLCVFENLAYYSHVWCGMSHFVYENHLLYHEWRQYEPHSEASHDYEW